MKAPFIFCLPLILMACVPVHIDSAPLPASDRETVLAPPKAKTALPIGKPEGPYAPGSIIRWDNGDGTFGAIAVHPRSVR